MDIKSGFRSIVKEDKQLSRRIRLKNVPEHFRKASEFFAHSGDTAVWWAALLVVWFFGNIAWKQWAITMAIGLGLVGAIMQAIKLLVKRPRPIGFWQAHARHKDPNSFPSGHAARSFMLAVVTTGIGPAWLAVLLWIWAPLVSLSRVSMGMHFLSDVIGGMLLALIVGLAWLLIHEGVLALLVSLSLRLLHIPLW
jgi:membrane-associated phospholipid phosphatase